MSFQKPDEDILQTYPTQQQHVQCKPHPQQTFNTNADKNCDFQPASPTHPDVVQSIEVHSYEDPTMAAPSQQTVEEIRVDETNVSNDTIKTNGKNKTLISDYDNEVKRLKRQASSGEVIKPQEMHIYNPKNKLKQNKILHNQAYKLSKLSNGYKIKINPSIPPLEAWPTGIKRVPRGTTGSVAERAELNESNSKEFQIGGDDKNIDVSRLYDDREVLYTLQSTKNNDHGKDERPVKRERRDRTVIKLIPREWKNEKLYQVHETGDEEPNQGSVNRKNSPINDKTNHVHNRTTTQQKNSQHVDPITVDKKSQEKTRLLTSEPPSDLSIHNDNTDMIIQKPFQESDLESKTSGSDKLREEMDNRRVLHDDDDDDKDYVHGYSSPGHRLDEQDKSQQTRTVTTSNEKGDMPYSSVPLKDEPSSSSRSDLSLGHIIPGASDDIGLHARAKTGHEETEAKDNNKDDGSESGYEESVISSKQNDDIKKQHETLQNKSIMPDDDNLHGEKHPQYNSEHEDSSETRHEGKEEEEEEEEEGGIYETLSKILQKKDAISRDEDVVGREDGRDKNKKQADSYRNYWVLEYSRPKLNK
jgi:hypothetical protein